MKLEAWLISTQPRSSFRSWSEDQKPPASQFRITTAKVTVAQRELKQQRQVRKQGENPALLLIAFAVARRMPPGLPIAFIVAKKFCISSILFEERLYSSLLAFDFWERERVRELEMEGRMETQAYYNNNQPTITEDRLTKTVEGYTAALPSSAFLGVAAGAMGLSLLLQVTGRGKWGNFIAQWVPTWLIIGLYNKLVKLEGHDRFDHDEMSDEQIGHYKCEFCDSDFSLRSDLQNHQRHCSARTPVT